MNRQRLSSNATFIAPGILEGDDQKPVPEYVQVTIGLSLLEMFLQRGTSHYMWVVTVRGCDSPGRRRYPSGTPGDTEANHLVASIMKPWVHILVRHNSFFQAFNC